MKKGPTKCVICHKEFRQAHSEKFMNDHKLLRRSRPSGLPPFPLFGLLVIGAEERRGDACVW